MSTPAIFLTALTAAGLVLLWVIGRVVNRSREQDCPSTGLFRLGLMKGGFRGLAG